MAVKVSELVERLRPVLEALKDDLLVRSEDPGVDAGLRRTFASEREEGRTGDVFKVWRRERVGQIAIAWVLSCVFVRTLEDRGLLRRRRIAGDGATDGGSPGRATDSEEQFTAMLPFLTARDYLLMVFREVGSLPGGRGLFDPRVSLVWRLSPSADGARALLDAFRKPARDGSPAPTFGGDDDARFLGDLYQDLDEGVRKKYALLQTPDFVEEFILEQTLDPAIEEFGLAEVRLFDPTCGSGHFLLGAFRWLLERWQRAEPATDPRELAGRALNQVYGADINPYAVAIARFRLTLALMRVGGYERFEDLPTLPTRVFTADTLYWSPQRLKQGMLGHEEASGQMTFWLEESFGLEDHDAIRELLPLGFHAVVGNPPYITCKDRALREAYRADYESAAGKYALAAPFTERFFLYALDGGFVGMINANSFMKREFGKALIETVLPRYDLTKIVDTSGAYIPGHGTPTVLLFGRHRAPHGPGVTAVLGIRGEPSTPDDAAQGLVWSSIRDRHDTVDFENDYISIAEMPREALQSHPWSLTGGGAVELKEAIEAKAEKTLSEVVDSIGITAFTLEDDVYLNSPATLRRHRVEQGYVRPMIYGEVIRDWTVDGTTLDAVFPYDRDFTILPEPLPDGLGHWLWPFRSCVANSKLFGGKTKVEGGLKWHEFGRLTSHKLRAPLSLTFAFVATHNHFALDRGGKVFNRTAPVIKLAEGATEEEHLALLGLLNSSLACFWMKQVCQNKGTKESFAPTVRQSGGTSFSVVRGTTGGGGGYEFDSTKIGYFPISENLPVEEIAEISKALDLHSGAKAGFLSGLEAREWATGKSLHHVLSDCIEVWRSSHTAMISLQENLDWLIYRAYGLTDCESEQEKHYRAFEAALIEDLKVKGFAAPFFGPDGQEINSPAAPEVAIAKRVMATRNARKTLGLLESYEFKRRWIHPDFDSEVSSALTAILLGRLEESFAETPQTPRGLARELERDPRVRAVAEVLTGESHPELDKLFAGLLAEESVPFVAQERYKAAGLEKYRAWQRTWDHQRREDAGEAVEVPVPPKYKSSDFRRGSVYKLRGKLDVPKERFISYPGLAPESDPSPLYGWAGWDHLERAKALAALYQQRKNDEGWSRERLLPLLAGLHELIPWLRHWHNEPDEASGLKLGDYFRDFLEGELAEHELTARDLEAWRPPKRSKGRKGGAGKRRKKRPPLTEEALLAALKTLSDQAGDEPAPEVEAGELAESLGQTKSAVNKLCKQLGEQGKLELVKKRPVVVKLVVDRGPSE